MSVLVPPKSVHEALSAVMAELPAIGKDEKAPQGYGYRGIEAITKHLQPLLAKHGVVIVPKAGITNVVPSPSMKEGWQDVYMTVEWTIVGPDGSILSACTTGIGRDNSDKGANKAQTQAFKYLVLHLFCVADAKDDSDSHNYDSGRAAAVDFEAVAKAAGWDSRANQQGAWDRLVLETSKLGLDDVKAWVKMQGLTVSKLTLELSLEWQSKISAAAVGTADPPADAAAETPSPVTPPTGPSHQDGTEPSPAATVAGEGGTRRTSEAAKRALAHAGLTDGEKP